MVSKVDQSLCNCVYPFCYWLAAARLCCILEHLGAHTDDYAGHTRSQDRSTGVFSNQVVILEHEGKRAVRNCYDTRKAVELL